MLAITALLITAILFGGIVLYSFGFAAFLFSHLPASDAGTILKSLPSFLSVVYRGSTRRRRITILLRYAICLACGGYCTHYRARSTVADARHQCFERQQ